MSVARASPNLNSLSRAVILWALTAQSRAGASASCNDVGTFESRNLTLMQKPRDYGQARWRQSRSELVEMSSAVTLPCRQRPTNNDANATRSVKNRLRNRRFRSRRTITGRSEFCARAHGFSAQRLSPHPTEGLAWIESKKRGSARRIGARVGRHRRQGGAHVRSWFRIRDPGFATRDYGFGIKDQGSAISR
jgi:hypothetical protein